MGCHEMLCQDPALQGKCRVGCGERWQYMLSRGRCKCMLDVAHSCGGRLDLLPDLHQPLLGRRNLQAINTAHQGSGLLTRSLWGTCEEVGSPRVAAQTAGAGCLDRPHPCSTGRAGPRRRSPGTLTTLRASDTSACSCAAAARSSSRSSWLTSAGSKQHANSSTGLRST